MEYAAARQHRNIEMVRQTAEVRGFADDLMRREQKFEKEKERAEELRNMKIREEVTHTLCRLIECKRRSNRRKPISRSWRINSYNLIWSIRNHIGS